MPTQRRSYVYILHTLEPILSLVRLLYISGSESARMLVSIMFMNPGCSSRPHAAGQHWSARFRYLFHNTARVRHNLQPAMSHNASARDYVYEQGWADSVLGGPSQDHPEKTQEMLHMFSRQRHAFSYSSMSCLSSLTNN